MTDYSKISKALRLCMHIHCYDCDYVDECLEKHLDGHHAVEGLLINAADAIEELQQIAAHYEETSMDYFKDVCYYMDRVQKWIPITSRPMTEEERKEYSERTGYDIEYDEAVIFVSCLPDDGQEVLTCNRYGYIDIDTFHNDPDYGCYFEKNGDMDGIVAWMPLPDPYRYEKLMEEKERE